MVPEKEVIGAYAANGWLRILASCDIQALPIDPEVAHPDGQTPKPAPQIHVNPDPAVRGNLTGQHDELNTGGN